jgi:hypothetical protein
MDETITADAVPRFVACIRNDGYEMDLALHRIYQVLPDASAERSGWIRIADETGEDYLYPETFFRPIEVPHAPGNNFFAAPEGRDEDRPDLRMMNSIEPPEAPRVAVCIRNDGYPAALERSKIYQMLPDPVGDRYDMVRIVDESGEGYLYPREFFQPIEVPPALGQELLRAS